MRVGDDALAVGAGNILGGRDCRVTLLSLLPSPVLFVDIVVIRKAALASVTAPAVIAPAVVALAAGTAAVVATLQKTRNLR